MKTKRITRRGFFGATLAGAATVAHGKTEAENRKAGTPCYGDYLKEVAQGNQTLAATEGDIEGPFFRANAPFKTTLHGKGEKREVLRVSGFVKARNGRPLKQALLEVWQANARGRYDNDDPASPPGKNEFTLRARLRTDEEGAYSFATIKPGAYKIGPNRYRPAHVHVKVHQKGYRSLTTQLYFEADPHNRRDPWFKKNRVVKFKKDEKTKVSRGSFTFVLPRA